MNAHLAIQSFVGVLWNTGECPLELNWISWMSRGNPADVQGKSCGCPAELAGDVLLEPSRVL